MFEEDFRKRLSELRNLKDVSAREMSLAIGQNPSYINNIEIGKALPSMTAFLFMCDYLNIAPKDFFDTESSSPELIRNLTEKLKQLTPAQIQLISDLVNELSK